VSWEPDDVSSRYALAGPVYDLLSLERLVYRRPRARLMEMLGPLPGATVVDVGCGTGLNFAPLRRLVGPAGTIVGVDSSRSMLAAARRRVAHGATRAIMVEGDVEQLPILLPTAGIHAHAIDAVVATFVVSLLADDSAFWTTLESLRLRRGCRVALAELGPPDDARGPVRPLLRMMTALGGGDPTLRPWEELTELARDTVHETLLGGHVHLAVGTWPG